MVEPGSGNAVILGGTVVGGEHQAQGVSAGGRLGDIAAGGGALGGAGRALRFIAAAAAGQHHGQHGRGKQQCKCARQLLVHVNHRSFCVLIWQSACHTEKSKSSRFFHNRKGRCTSPSHSGLQAKANCTKKPTIFFGFFYILPQLNGIINPKPLKKASIFCNFICGKEKEICFCHRTRSFFAGE